MEEIREAAGTATAVMKTDHRTAAKRIITIRMITKLLLRLMMAGQIIHYWNLTYQMKKAQEKNPEEKRNRKFQIII